MLREGSLYGMVEYTDRKRPWRAFGMVAHLVGYTSVVMLLPFFTCTSWYKALASVMIHIATSGLMFGFFSQVNHLNEHSIEGATTRNTPTASSSKKLCAANSWAAAQVEASNNFCTDSSLWHLLSNGLNLQIEHHLFPGLNHSHLHRIAPVVKATCEEYGVLYKTYDSWSELMRATLEWLDKLSIEA
jgi:linoleoyl-CoA desaturase